MTADERVATYLIEGQLADLTDAIREVVQNGIDSSDSFRVLVNISPERSLIFDDGAGIDLESTKGRRNLSALGAGSKQRADDEAIGEWGIGKDAIITKGAVRIWSHDTELCFDYRDRRGSGPWADVSGRDSQRVDAKHPLEGLLVEIDHSEEGVPDPDSYRWRRNVRGLRKCFVYVQSRTGVSVVINGEPVDKGDPLEVAHSRSLSSRSSMKDSSPCSKSRGEGLAERSHRFWIIPVMEWRAVELTRVECSGSISVSCADRSLQVCASERR
ncbi:hypothetical protein [Natrinema limicola]|uniref:Uncharacterized protein n=1 Tax=Natrinema limicola JCM 13563 TaxID=1230457 RepID=M0C1K9_9EURY|nr:hypothetical protein [Natrinema limicola]ELZ17085.1 hypothetical protein C476_16150 [Natrinema limicola JCM 13563]